jgi:hypothetical protein
MGHVAAVPSLPIKEVTEVFVRVTLPGAEIAVNAKDLLGVHESEADIPIIENIHKEVGPKGIGLFCFAGGL